MFIRIAFFILAAFVASSTCFAQTHGTTWHVGSGWPYQPVTRFDSVGASFKIIKMGNIFIDKSYTSMTDSLAKLLFYTNGQYLYNSKNEKMNNGNVLYDTINKSKSYYNSVNEIRIPQYILSLPNPSNSRLFYLFYTYVHDTIAPRGNLAPIGSEIIYSEVDMTLNGGLGDITIANKALHKAQLPAGGVHACRHANGRDWWVLYKVYNQNRFLRLLIDPEGIHGPYQQAINWKEDKPDTISEEIGAAWFNIEGDRYATMHIGGDMEVYDFDRATGLLSPRQHIPMNLPPMNQFMLNISNMVLSPSGRYAYVPMAQMFLVQIDLDRPGGGWAAEVIDTVTCCGVHDSISYIDYMAPGPDGKIYGFANSYDEGDSSWGTVHVIHAPDSAGKACRFEESAYDFHGISVQPTVPNLPNYCLGALKGSVADTLGLPANYCPKPPVVPPVDSGLVVLGPNPVRDVLHIRWGEPLLAFEVYDVTGRLVIRQLVAPDDREASIAVGHLAAAAYICRAVGQTGPLHDKLVMVLGN